MYKNRAKNVEIFALTKVKILIRSFADERSFFIAWKIVPLAVPGISAFGPRTHYLHAELKTVLVVWLYRVCK